jgi:hypothetical protein
MDRGFWGDALRPEESSVKFHPALILLSPHLEISP